MKNLLRILIVFILVARVVFAQSDALTTGDNLVVEGVPPIPISLAREVDQYTRFYEATLAGWHPTKREVLVNRYTSNSIMVYQVESPKGASQPVTPKIPAWVNETYYDPSRNAICGIRINDVIESIIAVRCYFRPH